MRLKTLVVTLALVSGPVLAQATDTPPVSIAVAVGHTGFVMGAVSVSNGKYIVSVGGDGLLKVWDAASGRVLRSILTPQMNGDPLDLGEHQVVVSNTDGTLDIWNIESGQKIQHFEGHQRPIWTMARMSDTGNFATGSFDGTIKIWNAGKGLITTLPGRYESVDKIQNIPAANKIIVASRDRKVRIWDLKKKKVLKTMDAAAASLEVSSDGKTFGIGYADGRYEFRSTSDGGLIGQHKDQSTAELDSFTGEPNPCDPVFGFSPTGTDIVFQQLNCTLAIYSLSSQSSKLLPTQPNRVKSLRYIDGEHVEALGYDASVIDVAKLNVTSFRLAKQEWRNGNESVETMLDPAILDFLNTHIKQSAKRSISSSINDRFAITEKLGGFQAISGNAIQDFAWDAPRMLFAKPAELGGPIQTIEVWDTARQERIKTRQIEKPIIYDIFNQPIKIGSDGELVAIKQGNKLVLWNIMTDRDTTIDVGQTLQESEVAFSSDDSQIFIKRDKQIDILSLPSGKRIKSIPTSGYEYPQVVISRDLEFYTILSGRKAEVRRMTDDAVVSVLQETEVKPAGIRLTDDGLYVVSSSPQFQVWDAKTGSYLLSSVVTNPETRDWVTYTSEGFFSSSNGGARALTVVRGLKAFSIDQAYQALYRPDLVTAKLDGDPNGAVRKSAAVLNLTDVVDSGSAPKATMTDHQSTQAVTDEIEVHAELTDQGGGIGKVEWRVNGTVFYVQQAESALAAPQTGRRLKIHANLSLVAGDNVIELVAYNGKGLLSSDAASTTIRWDGKSGVGDPKLYVLSIGVNNYWDSRLRLSFAAPDAKDLGEALRQSGQSFYKDVEIMTMLDENATAVKIDEVFSELAKKIRPKDVFLFFIAGHGKTIDGRYYFLPQDFRYDGEESIVQSGISQENFQQWVSRIAARKTILMYDTCESGSLTGEYVQQRGLERVAALDRLTRSIGRTTLSAATDDTPALEGYRGHGVFSYVVLEALGSGDANDDGLIDVTELASYVDRRVQEVSVEAFDMRQVPQMKVIGSNYPLVARLATLPTSSFDQIIPTKPTHVVVAEAKFRAAADPYSNELGTLSPGSQVTVVKTEGDWSYVARRGTILGYISTNSIILLQ